MFPLFCLFQKWGLSIACLYPFPSDERTRTPRTDRETRKFYAALQIKDRYPRESLLASIQRQEYQTIHVSPLSNAASHTFLNNKPKLIGVCTYVAGYDNVLTQRSKHIYATE